MCRISRPIARVESSRVESSLPSEQSRGVNFAAPGSSGDSGQEPAQASSSPPTSPTKLGPVVKAAKSFSSFGAGKGRDSFGDRVHFVQRNLRCERDCENPPVHPLAL